MIKGMFAPARGALNDMQSYLFGSGTDAPTYDALKRKREIANLLMAQTMQQPVNNWGDGVGKVLSALGARMMDRRLAGQEKADQDAAGGRLQEIISALGGGGMSPMPPMGKNAPSGGEFPPYGAGVGSGSPTGTAPPGFTLPQGGDFAELFPQLEQEYRLPQGYLARTAQIESGGRPDARNPNSSASGLFQFIDSTAAQYGVNQMDPVSSSHGAARLAADNAAQLRAALGREPTAAELYLAHQQGAGGAIKLLTNPGARAADIVGPDAVRLNGGDLTMSAQDFAGLWLDKFGGGGYSAPQYNPAMAAELGELIPRLPEGQRAVAQALLAQSLSQGTPMTPYQQESLALDRDRLAFDREKFASGTREGPKYYGNVQWAGDPDTGEYRPYQIGSDGTVNWIDLGGAQPMPPTRSADLGTSIAQVGPGGVTTGVVLDKDVRGEAGERAIGTAQGESVGGAVTGLAGAAAKAEQSMALIDSIIADPALEGITGMIEGRLPPMTQAGTDLNVKIDQLRGRVFTEAFESLKGGGAITEAEGRAATEAMGRLNRAQSVGEFQTALAELRGIISAGVERMRQKAAQAAPEAPAAAPDWMTQTDPTTWSEEQMLEAERHWGLR